MPLGGEPDAAGRMVDFDTLYKDLTPPTIEQAEMEPLRADEAMGSVHDPGEGHAEGRACYS